MTNWTISQKDPTPQTSDISFPNTWPLKWQKKLRNSAGHFFLLGLPNGEACAVCLLDSDKNLQFAPLKMISSDGALSQVIRVISFTLAPHPLSSNFPILITQDLLHSHMYQQSLSSNKISCGNGNAIHMSTCLLTWWHGSCGQPGPWGRLYTSPSSGCSWWALCTASCNDKMIRWH